MTTSKPRAATNARQGARPGRPGATPTQAPVTEVLLQSTSKTKQPVLDNLTTKQDRILALLSREDGASIEEILQATQWQQHSIRGFISGTVKRKLGFAVRSTKTEGEARRYRIDVRRGR